MTVTVIDRIWPALTFSMVRYLCDTIYDAGGMIGTTDVGRKTPKSCLVLNQVKNGVFVRVWPKKKGTFDCNKKNFVSLKLDLIK